MFQPKSSVCYLASNAFVPKNFRKAEKQGGHIVSISFQASKLGEYGNGVYSISKAGINMLTQVLRLEFARLGITVNAVCLGYVNTR